MRPLCSGLAASHWAVQEVTTSSASRALPSEKVTSGRSVKVHSVNSSLTSYFSASAGSTFGGADFVGQQRLVDLLAGPEGLAVGLVGAVEADRLGVLHEHQGVAAAVDHAQLLTGQRAAVCALAHCLEGRRRATVGHRDHGHVQLDQLVGLVVDRLALGRIGQGRRTL